MPSNNFVVAVHASWAVSGKRYSSMKPSLRRHLTNLGETAPPNFWFVSNQSVLFFAQGGERIHAGGALCRNVACEKRDASKNS